MKGSTNESLSRGSAFVPTNESGVTPRGEGNGGGAGSGLQSTNKIIMTQLSHLLADISG